MASDTVHNERAKLLANALDRASTAAVTIGVLAPIAASLYSVAGPGPGMWTLVVGAVIWFFAAVALHLGARIVLGRLRS